jgi:hypothetical protein
MSRVWTLLVVLVLVGVCAWLPRVAAASESVELKAAFEPDELGASTTISMGFSINTPRGEVPSPLTGVDLRLPAGVLVGSSTLGLATCNATTLEERGVGGCSPDALMGYGSAVVGVPIGPEVVYELVNVTMLMASTVGGHTAVSFYADGASPVIAQLVFPALLLGDSGLFGTRINTTIPPIAVLPGAPGAALVHMQLAIGPRGLRYYRRTDGHIVAFSPKGFGVPARCPTGGFPFAADFTFADGATSTARSIAPCPVADRHSHKRN